MSLRTKVIRTGLVQKKKDVPVISDRSEIVLGFFLGRSKVFLKDKVLKVSFEDLEPPLN